MRKFALLVGVSEYESDFINLPQAVKDVEALEKILLHPEMGNFAKSDVLVLKNPPRQTMEEAIEELFIDRQINDLILLFFSGHGIKDENGKLYLAATNTRKTKQGELVRSSSIAARFIHESMKRSSSMRQVIILDSCFSGAFADNLLAKDDGAIDIKQEFGGEGRAILTSSASTQYSFEEKGEDLSIYTRYLIEGIKTGKADRNNDGFISVGELHEYIKDKIHQIKPALQPKIYLGQGGNTINLVKIATGNLKEKYRQEISQYCSGKEITFVGRKILNTLRVNLDIPEAEAKQIEAEVLEPLRQEFNQKLQQYERDFTEALKQEVPLSEAEIERLRKNLQQLLDLKDEDTQPIEAKVSSKIKAYKQRLLQYEEEFIQLSHQEKELTETSRNRLQKMQQQWQLSDRDVAIIEKRINVENKLYKQKLSQYERALITAIQKQYPLSKKQQQELERIQVSLKLKSEDIDLIDKKITDRIKVYKQNLREYKQLLSRAIKSSYPIAKEIREELNQFKEVLQIRAEDAQKIEAKLVKERQIDLTPSRESLKQKKSRSKSIDRNPQQKVKKSNTPVARREYLKYIIFAGLGLGLASVKNLWPATTNTTNKEIKKTEPVEKTVSTEKVKPPTQSQLIEPKKSPKNSSSLELKTIEFETVIVNNRGQIIKRNSQTAREFSENIDNNINLAMISLPAGNFKMGSPSEERFSKLTERPQRQVNIKAFFMGKFPVTQAQWQAVAKLPKIARNLDPNPSKFKAKLHPVEKISWFDAIEFCQRLSKKTGRKYRLPSEAEWEYAVKARSNTPFYFGPNITSKLANFNGRFPYLEYESYAQFRNKTTRVGSFPPNAFGLYDMHGNVWEWCDDNWHNNYSGAPTDGRVWRSDDNTQHIMRGGSWIADAQTCRSCSRDKSPANLKYETLGMRVVLEI